MKQFALIITMLVMLASCGPASTPSPTPDINATMSAFSGTMVAATLTAQPTNTTAPTNTPAPTATATTQPTEGATPLADGTLDPSVPTATLDPLAANATPGSALPGGATPTLFTGTFSVGDLPDSQTALLRVENLSDVKEIIVTLNGVTKLRELPLYIAYKVAGALNINFYIGSWQYKIEIPGKTYMTGSFRQTNKDKTTMKVYNRKVVILGP